MIRKLDVLEKLSPEIGPIHSDIVAAVEWRTNNEISIVLHVYVIDLHFKTNVYFGSNVSLYCSLSMLRSSRSLFVVFQTSVVRFGSGIYEYRSDEPDRKIFFFGHVT